MVIVGIDIDKYTLPIDSGYVKRNWVNSMIEVQQNNVSLLTWCIVQTFTNLCL